VGGGRALGHEGRNGQASLRGHLGAPGPTSRTAGPPRPRLSQAPLSLDFSSSAPPPRPLRRFPIAPHALPSLLGMSAV
jgi:hypothetical protein